MSTQVFDCKMCGQCCNGKGGIILAKKDLRRLCAYFQMPEAVFMAQFGVIINGRPCVKQGHNGYCIFYQHKKGCSIHMHKPDVCRAWPFFRGNLEDAASLSMAREYCPGIDKNCEFKVFLESGLSWLENNNLIFPASRDTPNALVNEHLLKRTKAHNL